MWNRPAQIIAAILVVFGALAVFSNANACPFCVSQRGPTLVGDYKQAVMVLAGNFENARLDASGGLEGGTTDFKITKVLKDHPILKKREVINLPRYLPNQKNQYVIFCDVFKGIIDPYRGVEVLPKSDLVTYLEGAVARQKQPIEKRLRYCFDFLNSSDYEVSLDAYREYAKADYEAYKEMAKTLPADKIADWLRDENTSPFRYGLYGSLLGICGTAEHGKLLGDMLETPKVRKSSGIDGVLVGYMLIQERTGAKMQGLKYLSGILDNADEEFLMRYAVLRTLRFFWFTRKDVLSQKEIVQTVAHTLDHPDIADFGIEDLRKWKRWEMDKHVLDLYGKKSHDIRIIKRSIIRYALQSPTETCKKFLRDEMAKSKRNRQWVEEIRMLLELETGPTKTTSK